jgi:SAM domain (Sterile alpha motif)
MPLSGPKLAQGRRRDGKRKWSRVTLNGPAVCTDSSHKIAPRIGNLLALLAASKWYGAVMQQIADWLNTLGMSEYAQRFAENDIDIAVLPHLTDQHLKDLGVSLGHRLNSQRRESAHPPSEPMQRTTLWCTFAGNSAPL